MALLNRIVSFAFLLTLVLAPSANAEKYEYKEYTVKKGDTLWDISLAEIEDNFQWPLIWKENLRINNPDLIYPGQVIRIPIRVIPQGEMDLEMRAGEKVEAPAPEPAPLEAAAPAPTAEEAKPPVPEPFERAVEPTKANYIAPRETIIEGGYITKRVPNKGRIARSALNRKLFGLFDNIYIETKEPASVGDKFYVIRKEAKVKHPVTGRYMGYLVRVLGIVEAREAGTRGLRATIIESYASMDIGDVLDNYYEIDVPFHAGEPRKPQMDGYVVASRYMKEISGGFDLVFIDKGKEDGLLEGDVLMTLLSGTDDMQNSTLQIINTRDKTSLALILKSDITVKNGDTVTGIR